MFKLKGQLMINLTIYEQTLAARSVREFDMTKRVGEENLRHFIDCARVCPSAANLQVLKYRLVFDENESEKLFKLTRWAGYLKDIKLPPDGKAPTDFIVICHDTTVAPISDYSSMDVGICAQTINLAARERGFSSCMIGSFDKKECSALLNIPDEIKPVLVIAVGTPAEEPIICSVPEDGSIKYFRDSANLHFVPKRSLKEVELKK